MPRTQNSGHSRLKTIEYNATGNLTIPCVNQLRYVGNHLLEYLTHGTEKDLAEAESHCSRALYDAYEVEALYHLKTFSRFQDDYSDLTIPDCVPQYLEWCVTAERIQAFVQEHNQSDGRGAYYDAFDPHVTALREILVHLPHARVQLNRKKRKGRIDQRWVYAGIGLALGFGLFAVFAWIMPDLGKGIGTRMTSSATAASVSAHDASISHAPARKIQH